MTEIDLKKQIDTLVNLQRVDTEIYALKSEKSKKPEEVKQIDLQLEEKKKSLNESEKILIDLQKQHKDAELELASKEEAVKKLQTQLYQLKTNKEYQAMLQQINDTKADASVSEDKILELFDKIEKAKKEIAVEKEKYNIEVGKINEEKKKIDQRVKEIDDRLAQLDAERKRITPEVDKKILTQYERILSNRDGLAIVVVKDNSCQGCNMSVPPQVINLIRMYNNIVTCEVCNRILYITDESA